jgi:hypothetical protein
MFSPHARQRMAQRADGLGAGVDAQLLKELAVVPLDRVERQVEPVGDLLVGQPLGEQRHNLPLALGQWFVGHLLWVGHQSSAPRILAAALVGLHFVAFALLMLHRFVTSMVQSA